MLRVLLTLKPRDLYIAIKIMHKAVAGLCPAKLLADMPLDMPDVERQLRRLEKIGFLKVNGNDADSIAVLEKPVAKFSEHIKAFHEELDFSLKTPDLTDSSLELAKKSKRADMLEIIAFYAQFKGIQKEDLDSDFIKQHVRAAVKLLSAAGNVEKAKEVIEKVKSDLEKDNLEWSFNGAVINRMHSILRKSEKETAKKWDW